MVDRLRITELDFDTIKTNLKAFLKQQSEFSDYDFDGSGLNVLLDILAYNTHYNAYYLNMVANEAFLDTAILRSSVVSHAKTFGYTPYSVRSPIATINFTANSVSATSSTLTIPAGFSFLSNQIDNKSYNFVVINDTTVTKANSQFLFEGLELYEGQLITYNFSYNELSNPKQVFVLPDANIDTTTIKVSVSPSSTNTSTTIYTRVDDVLDIAANSTVYFLQEGRTGQYEIYFGNDVIGKKLSDGSVVSVTYLVTNATAANKANNFVATGTLSDTLGETLSTFLITPVSAAAGGADRETVDEIKFSAPLQYATQNRLVTIKDYESYIKKNYPSIDSLSVWGGEDEEPPIYGKVLISLKPKENYYLSSAEKQRIIDEIITPKSIISVDAEIRDPDYLYILLNNQVKYDPKKTTLTDVALSNSIRDAIISYKNTYLNKFKAIFAVSRLQDQIDNVDINSITGSETTVRLQKRVVPELNTNANYTVRFGVPIKRGTLLNRLTSTEFEVFDNTNVRRTAIIEEVPQSFTGISSIEITNAGYGYTTTPTVTITGDGTGATAEAIIEGGRIVSIHISNRGVDYTRAVVTITGGGGFSGSAVAVVDSKVGTLRTIYYDASANRQIIDSSVGDINYDTGIITLNDLKILSISASDGLLRLTVESEDGVIESSRSTIITIDEADTSAIVTTVEKLTA